MKKDKLKINKILTEKFEDMLENLDFEQDFWSRTAERICKKGHDSIRLKKWLLYYDRSYYDNLKYFDRMANIVKSVK